MPERLPADGWRSAPLPTSVEPRWPFTTRDRAHGGQQIPVTAPASGRTHRRVPASGPWHTLPADTCPVTLLTLSSVASRPPGEARPQRSLTRAILAYVSPNCTPDAEGDAGPRPLGSEGGVPFAKLDTRTSFLGCRHPLGSPSGILPELQNGSCRGLFSSLHVLRPPDPVRSWPPLTQSGVPCPPPDPVSSRWTRPTAPSASGHHCRPALVSCVATLPLGPRVAPVGHWVECKPQAKLQFLSPRVNLPPPPGLLLYTC